MRLNMPIALLAASMAVEAAPHLERRLGQPAGFQVNPDLVPPFGVTPGVDRDLVQKDNCRGSKPDGTPVLINCKCPPDRDAFIAKLNAAIIAGKVSVPDPKQGNKLVEFPIPFNNDASITTDPIVNKERATSALVVLQNFDDVFGVGCPAFAAPNFFSMQLTGVRSDASLVP